jgi:hypothetical protein
MTESAKPIELAMRRLGCGGRICKHGHAMTRPYAPLECQLGLAALSIFAREDYDRGTPFV